MLNFTSLHHPTPICQRRGWDTWLSSRHSSTFAPSYCATWRQHRWDECWRPQFERNAPAMCCGLFQSYWLIHPSSDYLPIFKKIFKIRWMEEILHQLIGGESHCLSHCFNGFQWVSMGFNGFQWVSTIRLVVHFFHPPVRNLSWSHLPRSPWRQRDWRPRPPRPPRPAGRRRRSKSRRSRSP